MTAVNLVVVRKSGNKDSEDGHCNIFTHRFAA